MSNASECGRKRKKCITLSGRGWVCSHVHALSLWQNHNARDALHKNVICTQIAAFACGLFSSSSFFLALFEDVSSFSALSFSLVKSRITSLNSTINSSLRRLRISMVDFFLFQIIYTTCYILLCAYCKKYIVD